IPTIFIVLTISISKDNNAMQGKNKRVVERIIEHKFINGSVSYLVKWKGYPEDENSWKLQDEIIKYAELIEYYWENFENHPSSKSLSKGISPSSMTTDSTLPSQSIIETNSSKIVGDNIPRFYEPDWDSHVECIETIYHDETNNSILRNPLSFQDLQKSLVLQLYDLLSRNHSHFKTLKETILISRPLKKPFSFQDP
ncbi:10007_t:CDS:2, partial [Dentiscutata erythropus]